jgi:replicative DNA helicase
MERAVLGAILAGHQQAGELLDILKPEDFFDQRHGKIARVVLALYEAGTRPDLLAVHDELARSGESDPVEVAYIASLLDGIALKSDVLYVLRGLRRMASFRQAAYLADGIKQLAMEQAGTAESLLDSAVERFSSLARDLKTRKTMARRISIPLSKRSTWQKKARVSRFTQTSINSISGPAGFEKAN